MDISVVLSRGNSDRTTSIIQKHFRFLFGSYVDSHDNPNITTNMAQNNHECIALGTTGNIQGIQKVFSLNSGWFLKELISSP